MRAHTLRFGELEIPEEAVVLFPQGIPGFPQLQRCCLLPHDPSSGLRWLQCLSDPTLSFLTLEPHLLFPDYEIELGEADQEALGLTRAEDAVALTLVTISHDGGAVTTNLVAPIIINRRTRAARQVILDDGRYCARHLIGLHRRDAGDARSDAESR